MSEPLVIGGKIYKKGTEHVLYKIDGEYREFLVIDKTEDGGMVLQNTNNKRQFAIGKKSLENIKKMDAESATPKMERTYSSPAFEPEMPELGKVHVVPTPKMATTYSRPAASEPSSAQRPSPVRRAFESTHITEPSHTSIPPSVVAYEFVIFCALAVHIIDAWRLNFSPDYPWFMWRVLLYFMLGMIVHFTLNRGWGIKESIWEMFKVSLIPLIGVPLLRWILTLVNVPDEVSKVISVAILAIPIWLFYIMFVRGETREMGAFLTGRWFKNIFFTPSGWAHVWFFVLFIAVMWFALSTLGQTLSGGPDSLIPGGTGIGGTTGIGSGGGILPSTEEFDVGKTLTDLKDFLGKSLGNAGTTIQGLFGGIKDDYNKMKNDTLGGYYTGQVEQNKELTGVFITDLHVTGKQYDTMPVVAYGYVKARSFVEGINITPSCFAQSLTNKSRNFQGVVTPRTLDNIYVEDQRGVICTFEGYGPEFGNPMGYLPPDRYQIYLILDFDFETWAYKQYYFVDRDYIVYLRTTGLDPNTEMGIPQITKTIYTNGPVMIGMDDKVEMPFGLSNQDKSYIPIGMTIDDKTAAYGAKGQVIRVYEYTLRLPQEMVIPTGANGDLACTIKGRGNADPTVPGYMIYTFDLQQTSKLIEGAYMSLNCNVEIPPGQATKIIPGANTPALVSIVGTSRYAYRLSKYVSVEVEKTPGT